MGNEYHQQIMLVSSELTVLGKPRVLPSVMPPSEDEAGTDPSLGGWGRKRLGREVFLDKG